jgi:hypothetical protein
MRLLLTYIFFFAYSSAFSQIKISSLIKGARAANLPYSTEGRDISFREKRKILRAEDSLFLVSRLKEKLPRTVNPYGYSPFGEIDCTDTSDCLNLSETKEISILSYIKITEKLYLLHIELDKTGFNQTKSILISITADGQLMDWIISDGYLNDGNPNGNVSRDFLISTDKSIIINETSWGKNTTPYTFKSTLIIDQNNTESDLYGQFALRSLCIEIF